MQTVNVSYDEMKDVFYRILLRNSFSESVAETCARIFTENSLDGIYTHGVNRFPRFIEYVKHGIVKPANTPTIKASIGAFEQWAGNEGPGITNALFITDRVMDLAKQNGIACIGLSNTNHWMRGGTYGWKAAKAGFVLISWTNTIGIMPAWGAKDPHIGNNPLVVAVPFGRDAIVLDMAMSQYSYGAMELAVLKHEQLGVTGGFDEKGLMTTDPSSILLSGRPLPIGYWKGAGLALLLDIMASLFSGGLATHEISKSGTESNVSQVFIAIDLSRLPNFSSIQQSVQQIISDYHASIPENEALITYPGEKVLRTRHYNLIHGIPVLTSVWETIQKIKLRA